jgi:cell division protein FtsB
MKATRQRSRRQTFLYAALVLFVAALVLDGVFGPHGLIAAYRLRLQVQQEQEKIQKVEKQNREFSKQVRELKTDPSAIEQMAHRRMGMVKPGELVFKLPPLPPKSAQTTPATPTPQH